MNSKTVKTILSVFLLILLAVPFMTTVYADNDIKLELIPTETENGYSIDVHVQNVQDIAMIQLMLQYSPEVLKCTKVSAGSGTCLCVDR